MRVAAALCVLSVAAVAAVAAACGAQTRPSATPQSTPAAPAPGAAATPATAARAAASDTAGGAPARVTRLVPRVLAVWPHDPKAFTQGLLFDGGQLLESTGRYGVSDLRRVELETGAVVERAPLDRSSFGEGLGRAGNRLVQLTWREHRALAYRAERDAGLAPLPPLHYDGEGWGLTFDGSRWIMSDGSGYLIFRDAETFVTTGRVLVTLDGVALSALNELEFVDGSVWANVWQTDRIVKIDPASGKVTAVVEAAGLLDAADRTGADVLNGIAYDPGRKVFYITGKLWPKLFEVEFVE